MIRAISYLCIALVSSLVFAQDAVLPPKEQFHLFLLVGQSNMAGRGTVEDQDRVPHARILMMSKEGDWVPAVDPMHFDKPSAGVGLGRSFAQIMMEATPGATIGLIPCAVGGSPIDAWRPGEFYAPTKSHPWDDMQRRVSAAMKVGTLKGILWHQGEADCKPELAPSYEAKLHDLIARMRSLVGEAEAPFLAGQMGKFEDVPWSADQRLVDSVHQSLVGKVPHTSFVSAEGLKHKGDKIHFDSASYRELGKRYAASFLKMCGK
ncbi:MAG: sialate O-acetylesterase [Verrucomicrobiaceae bacterium]|nr:sialate O-acetylesterase [Verrucomicrobiaceae bacterium]